MATRLRRRLAATQMCSRVDKRLVAEAPWLFPALALVVGIKSATRAIRTS